MTTSGAGLIGFRAVGTIRIVYDVLCKQKQAIDKKFGIADET